MGFKKKLTILLVLTGFLGVVYAATLVFDPERVSTRDASYRWLDPESAERADRIEISRPGGEGLNLVRNSSGWFVSQGNAEYPAKEARVEDLLRFFTSRAAFPIRANSAASHERFGLTEGAASRIVIRGGPTLLLDLLAGNGDALGRDLYLRKISQEEVRSGEDRISPYLNGAPSSWYMLRLFPESSGTPLGVDTVQQLTVSLPPDSEGAARGTFTLRRDGGNWVQEDGTALDNLKVEGYIRAIIEAEGEDFVPDMKPEDSIFSEGSITLSVGDGSTRFIRLGPSLESGSRSAAVSGSSYIYALAAWTVNRIFREPDEFVTGTP